MNPYPIVNFGGSGLPVNFAPANGFPPATYLPLINLLTEKYRVFSLLPRPLWGNDTPPAALHDWRDAGMSDLLTGIETNCDEPIVAVGHSFGGIISMLAAIEAPQRFKALVLLDPTILTHEIVRGMAYFYSTDPDQLPLAARALKRRREFTDHDDAFSYFRQRSLFDDWSDEALNMYITHGTRSTENGTLTLVWSPEWEAYIFKTGYLKTWEQIPKLDGLLPTLILRGTKSDTYVQESAQEVRALLPSAHHEEIPGHGHLFPMTAPQATAARITAFLDAL